MYKSFILFTPYKDSLEINLSLLRFFIACRLYLIIYINIATLIIYVKFYFAVFKTLDLLKKWKPNPITNPTMAGTTQSIPALANGR